VEEEVVMEVEEDKEESGEKGQLVEEEMEVEGEVDVGDQSVDVGDAASSSLLPPSDPTPAPNTQPPTSTVTTTTPTPTPVTEAPSKDSESVTLEAAQRSEAAPS
jgi:hypothetical protein